MSLEIANKVADVLDGLDVPERHSYYQLKHFVVGKECTIQGQLWQVVREMRSRRESYENLSDEFEETEDRIRLIESRLTQSDDHAPYDDQEKLYREIRIRRLNRKLRILFRSKSRLDRLMFNLSQEMGYLLGAYESLSKVEPIKPFDDYESQRAYWNERYTEELNLRLILGRSLDSDFVRCILALEDDMPIKKQMIAILGRIQDEMVLERDRVKAIADPKRGD